MLAMLMPWRLLLCRPLDRQLANMECNAGSAVQITHHFLAQMVSQRACRTSCAVLQPRNPG